ncbi:MAG: FAD-dependent oxidoreductase [Kiritimatiellia bacterium]|nr:FAD-dependent oxidoreductase [Kiritimatiellia bacterium]
MKSPIASSVDVLVVGAGIAGVAAASAAARRGAHVLLLENRPASGGALADGLGFPLCGLFENDTSLPPRLLNSGLGEDLLRSIRETDPEAVFAQGKVYLCRCETNTLRSILRQWMNLPSLVFQPDVSSWRLELSGDRVAAVEFHGPDGMEQTVALSQLIDCTGLGRVVDHLGAAASPSVESPLAGYCIRVGGLAEDDLLPVRVPYHLRDAVGSGALPAWCRFTFFTYGLPTSGEGVLKFNFPQHLPVVEAAAAAEKAVLLLKQRLAAFRDCALREVSPGTLPREGSRLLGRYTLSEEEVRAGRRFPDEVARCAWPIEYWDSRMGPSYVYPGGEGVYGIPAGCLQSSSLTNLWAAGRCLSASSKAMASARVAGIALATGEAAGRAAAERLA